MNLYLPANNRNDRPCDNCRAEHVALYRMTSAKDMYWCAKCAKVCESKAPIIGTKCKLEIPHTEHEATLENSQGIVHVFWRDDGYPRRNKE